MNEIKVLGEIMSLTITTESSSYDSLTVILDGQLNDESAPAFEKAVCDNITESLVTVVLDMKKLSFIFQRRHRRHYESQNPPEPRRPPPGDDLMPAGHRKVFEMIHLLPMMRSFVSEAHLDDYLAAVQKEINDAQNTD